MQQSKGKPRIHDTVMLSGWLFADLFLALTVLFLSANTVGPKLKPIPTPTPIPTSIPTPTPEPRLDFNYQTIQEQVDYVGLLNNSSQAKEDLKQKIRGYSFLWERSVGLAIAYGGAPTPSDIPQARQVAAKVYGVLQELGQSGFAFQRASYYYPDPDKGLYNLGDDASMITIHIYLFE